MKTFDGFNNMDEKEELFLSLAHLDELVIRFDFMWSSEDIFYFYNKTCLFVKDKKNKMFSINSDEIWSIYRNKINMSYHSTRSIMNIMSEKYFNLKVYSINYFKGKRENNYFNI